MDFFKADRVLLFLVILLAVCQYSADAVSVKPSLCPTNKIAPHRRIASRERARPRTFSSFYELFSNNDQQYDSPSSLQEQPQEDDPEDCGDIDDYDETDLSSITPQAQRKGGNRESRFFFSNHEQNQNRPPYQNQGSQGPYPAQVGPYPNQGGPNYPNLGSPNYPNQGGPSYPNPGGSNYPNQGGQNYPNRPTGYPVRPRPPAPFRPQRPGYPPVRPPYSSGGVFSNNQYRPQYQQNPSDGLKPVFEGNPEPSATYRPGVVGGPVSHITGHSPAPYRPTPPVQVDDVQQTRRPRPMNQVVFERPDANARPRRYNNSGILGSFLDLFFK